MPLPIEPEPIRREIPKRSEMGSYTMHSLSPIRERAREVWKEMLNLIPAGILGWARSEVPEDQIDVGDEQAEELADRASTLIGYFRPGVPFDFDTGVFYEAGAVTRGHKIIR